MKEARVRVNGVRRERKMSGGHRLVWRGMVKVTGRLKKWKIEKRRGG